MGGVAREVALEFFPGLDILRQGLNVRGNRTRNGIIVAMVLSGCVLSYVWILRFSPWGFSGEEWDRHRQTVGDYTYYLGFLFTLVALAASLSLLALRWTKGDAPAAVEVVIANNGIALITTIVGLGLRALVQPISTSSLQDDFKELSSQVSGLASVIQRLAQNRLTELDGKLGEVEAATKDVIANTEDATEAVSGYVAALEAAANRAEAYSQHMAQFIEGLKSAGDGAESFGDELRTVSDEHLSPFEKNMESASGAASQFGEALENATSPLSNWDEGLLELEARLQELGSNVGNISAAVSDAAREIENVSVDQDAVNDAIEGALEPLRSECDGLEVQLKELRRAFEEVDVPEEVIPARIVHQFERLSSCLTEAAGATDQLVEMVGENEDTPASSIRDRLSELNKALEEMVTNAGRAASGMGELQARLGSVPGTAGSASDAMERLSASLREAEQGVGTLTQHADNGNPDYEDEVEERHESERGEDGGLFFKIREWFASFLWGK